MADHKSSHKNSRSGSRIGTEAEDGVIDKNKTRNKYKTSIPLQTHQAMAKNANQDLHRACNGNSPRPESRAMSETSEIPSETDPAGPTGNWADTVTKTLDSPHSEQ